MSINQIAEKIETQETEAKAQIYQAIGVVTGVLNISDSKKPTLLIEEHTYPVSVERRALWKHQPGEVKSFLAYPKIIDEELGFILLWVKSQAPETHIFALKGCWEEEENQAHLKIYRNRVSFDGNFTSLSLTWEHCPLADGQYWEIEAELRGDSFNVVSAIGPFDPPKKHLKQVKKAESDLPPPILRGDRYTKAKSELPPPILKSAKVLIEPTESKLIAENANEPIASIESTAIEETTIAASEEIEPQKPEKPPVAAEPMTPKTKKAGSKTSASKKTSVSPESVEPKKTKEKVKNRASKKPMSLPGTRLFLGKQLPPGK